MTVKELRKVTKCHIFIERTDADGAVRRTEYLGATRDWQICELKIVRDPMEEFVLCVRLEEEGA